MATGKQNHTDHKRVKAKQSKSSIEKMNDFHACSFEDLSAVLSIQSR
jgi:hypothetical protein